MDSRAQRKRLRATEAPALRLGDHFTLTYRQADTGEEHFSSVDEVVFWIKTGPLLQPPTAQPDYNPLGAPITTPSYTPSTLQFVPHKTVNQRVSIQAGNQRVSTHTEEQRVSLADSEQPTMGPPQPPLPAPRRSTRIALPRALMAHGGHTSDNIPLAEPPGSNTYEVALPPTTLLPQYPTDPLNLNEDGTPINHRKAHRGPNKDYWTRADAEEFQRLFQTGTIRPIQYEDIPATNVVTYVNPVCSEKLNDDGSIKFRTRMTIGGDRINYPFDKSAETADLDAVKLLLNCMISENANWSTLDLTDFYLGTDLPHPEYIRIPETMIPAVVTERYGLRPYIHNHTLYASVHKTHYGLPQAGALSQQRLFRHLHQHRYRKMAHTPSCFRNTSGTIRFSLVVDDFAVVWTSKEDMDHLIHTLQQLYQVKVIWEGNKYLGMDIDVDRTNRHVTISMPGYVSKLLRRVRPDGLKGASTPGIYMPLTITTLSPIARQSTHPH
jgi:hypothetical protein